MEVPGYLSQCCKQLGLSEQRMLQTCKYSHIDGLSVLSLPRSCREEKSRFWKIVVELNSKRV